MSEFYTVCRVKRKREEDRDERYESSKRFCLIGSFAEKHDEEGLSSKRVLERLGFTDRKRIRFNDFDTRGFSSYFDLKTENDKSEQTPKTADTKIAADNAPSSKAENEKSNNSSQITCNGTPMTVVDGITDRKDQYLYDYYIMIDDLMDFQKDEEENPDEEPSSNDENYPYNDYPDEGEVSDSETDDDEEDEEKEEKEKDGDEDEYRYFDEEEDPEAYKDIRDTQMCGTFEKLYLGPDDDDGDDEDDDDDDYETEKIPTDNYYPTNVP